MRVSIEVGHPSHVHYWRNVIRLLRARAHTVNVYAREKEMTLQLLRAYGIPYRLVGRSRSTLVGKAFGLPWDDFRVLQAAREDGIEFMLSTGIPGSAHASRLLGVPHLSLIDTEVAWIGRLLTEPFSDAVCTPASFQATVHGSRHIRFAGYLELMYLHPDYFEPDPSILEDVGISAGEPLALVRFSSWDSSHDLRRHTSAFANPGERLELVEALAERFRVLVTSEVPLPDPLDRYRLQLAPQRMHSLLSFASVYVGEGAKMASEAGVLGVPWIFLSRSPRGYLEDQERRYGLGKTLSSAAEVVPCLEAWRSDMEGHAWASRRERLLRESVDVVRFVTDLVEGWPESAREAAAAS